MLNRKAWVSTAALLTDTLREAAARRVFWGFYGLSTAFILFFLFLLRIDLVQGARATFSLFGTTEQHTIPIAQLTRQVHGAVASFLYTLGMLLAIFASAGLIAATFETGRIELLLSKPLSRVRLLLCRYIGCLIVVGVNIAYMILGVWLVFGWKADVWDRAFLYVIPITTFMFAVLLGAVVLVVVLSDSAALATMITFALMIGSPILAQRDTFLKLLSSEWSRWVWRTAYAILPKVFDTGRMLRQAVLGQPVQDFGALWSSAAFLVVVLGVSLVALSRKDF